MATYVLFWNPDISSYTKERFLQDFSECEGVGNWSFYEHNKVKKGDSFFMVKCGEGKTGIVMRGEITSMCYRDRDWSPKDRKIIGGYRYILGRDIKMVNGHPRIATSHMFDFSERFIKDYLPYTIELGRSFVRLEYQSSRAGAKAIFALDNLWDGLGALTVLHPEIRYLFGKFTMYPSYDRDCRNMLLYFLNRHFPDNDDLARPYFPIRGGDGDGRFPEMFPGNSFLEDYRTLNTAIREHGINIPPLVNAYMSLSPTRRIFGTAINDEFGDVEETGIFLTISEVYDEKIDRHVNSFHPEKQQ